MANHFGARAHCAACCGTHSERVDLAFELEVLFLRFAGTILEVGDILRLACAIVPLLEKGTRWRDGEIFPPSTGHGGCGACVITVVVNWMLIAVRRDEDDVDDVWWAGDAAFVSRVGL